VHVEKAHDLQIVYLLWAALDLDCVIAAPGIALSCFCQSIFSKSTCRPVSTYRDTALCMQHRLLQPHMHPWYLIVAPVPRSDRHACSSHANTEHMAGRTMQN
jgi:hypothetical protein